MAYFKKPEDGQETKFMSSQGSGMIGGLGAVGGLGVAGGPSSGRSPFINPESYRNVQAGEGLQQRLGETFTKPAAQISSQIGEEQDAFKLAAEKQKLGSEHLGILGGQVAKTPMSLGGAYDPESKSFQGDLGELQKRLALQYEGPQKFNPSAAITDPLAKLQERVNTYGVSEPGTGIQREGVRSSLLGEIMKPTATSGQKALENYLLTSSPGALQNLQNTIAGVGGTTTQSEGAQASPMARLKQARDTMADLVKSRQEAALKAQEDTRRDIGLGMDVIEAGVEGDISKAIADAKAREALITGEYISPEDRAEGFDPLTQLPELFSGAYGETETPEEWALAERLGLATVDPETGERVDQVTKIQELLEDLSDPYGKDRFLSGGEYQGDEVTGVGYETLDPLGGLFTALNPEDVYTREQMIGEEQAGRLGELQELLTPGANAPIVREEGALGAGERSIETRDVQNWIDQLAGFREEKQQKADEIRASRAVEEVKAVVGPPPQRTGNQIEDTESYLEWRTRLEGVAAENKVVRDQIAAFDSWQEDFDKLSAESEQFGYNKEAHQELMERRKLLKEPSHWDRFNNFIQGTWAKDEIAQDDKIQNERQTALDKALDDMDLSGIPAVGPVGGGRPPVIGGETPGTRYYGGAPVAQGPQKRSYGGQSVADDY